MGAVSSTEAAIGVVGNGGVPTDPTGPGAGDPEPAVIGQLSQCPVYAPAAHLPLAAGVGPPAGNGCPMQQGSGEQTVYYSECPARASEIQEKITRGEIDPKNMVS